MALLTALMLLAPAQGAAATSGSPSPNGTWVVTQHLVNTSPYELKLLQTTLTENANWRHHPDETISAYRQGSAVFANDTPSHGLASLLVYGAYNRSNNFVGAFVTSSGVDCTIRAPAVCLDYRRFEQAAVDRGGTLGATWSDNGGQPANFQTRIEITVGRPGSAADSGDWTSTSTDSGPPKLAPWVVSVNSLVNASQYTLRLNKSWSSEGSSLVPGTSVPAIINPGSSTPKLSPSYINVENAHGPAGFQFYDAFDTSNRYVGSVAFTYALECPTSNIKEGCSSQNATSNAVAAAVEGHQLRVEHKHFSVPPFALYVDFAVSGGPFHPGDLPPPDRAPTTPTSAAPTTTTTTTAPTPSSTG